MGAKLSRTHSCPRPGPRETRRHSNRTNPWGRRKDERRNSGAHTLMCEIDPLFTSTFRASLAGGLFPADERTTREKCAPAVSTRSAVTTYRNTADFAGLGPFHRRSSANSLRFGPFTGVHSRSAGQALFPPSHSHLSAVVGWRGGGFSDFTQLQVSIARSPVSPFRHKPICVTVCGSPAPRAHGDWKKVSPLYGVVGKCGSRTLNLPAGARGWRRRS